MMKTILRALDLTVGASITCWYFDKTAIEAGVIICLMLVIILPIAAQFDGDSDEN